MATGDIRTIILRFRDLATASGETLRQHKKIASSAGSVWWGWWNKAGETVADDAFRHVKGLAQKKKGLNVLLFDTGNGKIHNAVCTDVSWDTGHKRIGSPDIKKTPKYYKTQQYMAWFKLSSLEMDPIPEDALKAYTYVCVNEFFETGRSPYSLFYGKQVCSVNELKQQARTIWFVRGYAASDPTNQILWEDVTKSTPGHFPMEYRYSPSTTLLWLSDLHFSDSGHHAFPKGADSYAKDLGLRMHEFLNHGGFTLGGIVVSGDLTYQASCSEFDRALEFLEEINRYAALHKYQLAICPGNHDIGFTKKADLPDPVPIADGESTQEYGRAYQALFSLKPNPHLSCGRKFLLGNAVPVELVCLNSALLQQRPGVFEGHGYVGEDQLSEAANQMGWDRASHGALRVVSVHHNLLPVRHREKPVPKRNHSAFLDAEALLRWAIKCGVHLIMHGHMHEPFVSKISRPDENGGQKWRSLYIAGMGTAGGKDPGLETPKNTFALVRFERKALTIDFFSVAPALPPAPIKTVTLPIED